VPLDITVRIPAPKPATLRWEYDSRSYSYRDARTGRYLSNRDVRKALDATLVAPAGRARALAEALRERRISLAEWQTQMMREIKTVHLWGAATAKGGWAQLTPADYGRVGQRIREQYAYLRTRAEAIATGAQALDGNFVSRMELYGLAGRATYHATETREMELRGMTEERSVRGDGDSCAGCVAAAALEWQPIGSVVPVGQRNCLSRCRCWLIFR
jgi:CubicO group peptidase (beta-lactamase class C family)